MTEHRPVGLRDHGMSTHPEVRFERRDVTLCITHTKAKRRYLTRAERDRVREPLDRRAILESVDRRAAVAAHRTRTDTPRVVWIVESASCRLHGIVTR